MSHAKRIRELRDHLGLGRHAFAEETGIKKKTLENIELDHQKVYAEHLEAIGNRWPQYRFWLYSGETLEAAGQISPETERTEQR